MFEFKDSYHAFESLNEMGITTPLKCLKSINAYEVLDNDDIHHAREVFEKDDNQRL